MSEVLNTEERTETGTKRMRRLRQQGFTPAVLYGENGGESVHLAVKTRDVNSAIRHGTHVVRLEGKVSDDALIKDVQWDALGSVVLHLDLTRVDLNESISVTLPVELVGVAPGTKQGGVVNQLVQELEIECPAKELPDKIEIKINDLELDQTITAAQLELPEGAKAQCESGMVLVQCIEPTAEVEQEVEPGADGDAAAEPEVIGRKDDEGGDGEGEG